jgi:hypothetical protein
LLLPADFVLSDQARDCKMTGNVANKVAKGVWI